MKKTILFITALVMMLGCAPREHTIRFEELSLWAFQSCITHNLSYDTQRQLDMSPYFSLDNCTLKVVSLTPKFKPKEYKKALQLNRYNSESEAENFTGSLEDYKNKGDFIIPSGDGYIDVYNSLGEKVCEIMYQKSLPYSFKIWDSKGILFEAEGIFDKYHIGSSELYSFLSGHCELIRLPRSNENEQ